MRVRVVRIIGTDRDYFSVQRWKGHRPYEEDGWEHVKDFQSDQYDLACEYAMTLSMRKESTFAKACFEDGADVSYLIPNCTLPSPDVHSAQSTP